MWGKQCALILFFFIAINAKGQKTWDGEAGDSLWHSAKNWFPDGVPGPADDVIIDNSKISGSYKVLIGSGDSITIHTVRINPSENHQIVVEITSANTLPIAFYIQSSSKGIVLEKNAVFINHTGASTGNIFSLNGSMYISNGGKYVHKTIRGNSYIISKLEIDTGSKKGIIEFDVPGTAGYTLSLSGRKFGSLVLSANESSKKSYSGNGSNKLTIEGDLTVNENASFTSTISNIVQVNGDLTVSGICALNPGTPDTIGRSFVLGGDSSKIQISGIFKTGINFNQFTLGSHTNRLKSNFILDNGSVVLNNNASICLDTFYLKSSREITIMKHGMIETANKIGISKDTNIGTLRSPVLKLEDSLKVIYTSNENQFTGENLPTKIKSLSKFGTGKLFLSKPLEVIDSLNLTKGNIKSDSINKLTFSGKYLNANENGFIEGIAAFNIQTDGQAIFPIGKNNQYAPVWINCKAGESIQVEYVDSASQFAGQKLEFPVKNVSQLEYWKITSTRINSTDSIRTIILGTKLKNSITNNTYLVRLNDSLHWEMLPLLSNNPVPYTVGAKTNLTSTIYSTGTIQQVALASNRFSLSIFYNNGGNILTWTFDSNEYTKQYVIQGSYDGKSFTSIDSIKPVLNPSSFMYTYEIEKKENHFRFFRIKAIQINNVEFFSNIILFKSEISSYKLFPNPCTDQLKFSLGKDMKFLFWITERNGTKFAIPYQKNGKEYILDVSKLRRGFYYLSGLANGVQIVEPFIKN
jgi:hypothetical protein